MTTLTGSESAVIDRMLQTIGDLPTPPTVVADILKLTADVDSDVPDLASAVLKDQIISAKVLRLANSPFYGRSRAVDSISDAISILGFQSIRSIVLASNVRGMFSTAREKALIGPVWLHSLASATGARVTAVQVRGVNSELAYLGGLMKEIGTMIFLKKKPEEYGARLKDAIKYERNRCEVELDQFGFTHLELGAQILERWNLPSSLSTIVRFYDQPKSLTEEVCVEAPVETVTKTANVVQFAGGLAESLGYGIVDLQTPRILSRALMEPLVLTNTSVDSITSETVERFEVERSVMDN